jgi:magnesium chelatase accessory protein
MKARLDRVRDAASWPHHAHSRYIRAGSLDWHVQEFGAGPPLLLLHGTGASTHSFRALAPLLARDHQVIACDLPGHGFTENHRARDLTLPGMAQAIGALLQALNCTPQAVIGHSAGCAVAVRMHLDEIIHTPLIIGLNAALLPFPGAAGRLFPSMARALFLNPLAPVVFASQANRRSVARLIAGTGSTLDEQGIALYARLFETSAHVSGAIGMMAQWDLETLSADLPRLTAKLALIVGADDKAVPAGQAETVKGLVPNASVISLSGLGHLAHEEAPETVEASIRSALRAG